MNQKTMETTFDLTLKQLQLQNESRKQLKTTSSATNHTLSAHTATIPAQRTEFARQSHICAETSATRGTVSHLPAS
jgi:hypothetical protein